MVLLGLHRCFSKLQKAKILPKTKRSQDLMVQKLPPTDSQQTVHFFLALPSSVQSYFKSQQNSNLDPMDDASIQHICPLKGKSFHYPPSLSNAAPESNLCSNDVKAFDKRSLTTISAPSQCHPLTAPQYQESTCTMCLRSVIYSALIKLIPTNLFCTVVFKQKLLCSTFHMSNTDSNVGATGQNLP